MALAMVVFALLLFLTGSYLSPVGFILFLATLAAYGLVLLDIWQDENSFGAYGYIATAWHSLWAVVGVIMDPHSPYRYGILATQLIILAGLWKRYGSPFGS